MPEIVLDLDDYISQFTLSLDQEDLKQNYLLEFTLKELKYQAQDAHILIPYTIKTKVKVLKQIQQIFNHVGVELTLSPKINSELSSFSRDQDQFERFTSNAKQIRNEKITPDSKFYEQYQLFLNFVSSVFVRPLKEFQKLSAFHMAFAQHSCNFSVPGAGKTAIVLAAYSYLKAHKDTAKKIDRIVVIGPFASFAPWEDEFKHCFGYKVVSNRIYGGIEVNRRKQHLVTGQPAELTLISYSIVPSLLEEIAEFIEKHNVMVVVDEAHRIKNQIGKQALATLEASSNAKSRIVLTGTPLPNGYQDLYNLYKFIYPFHYETILNTHYSNLVDLNSENSYNSKDRVLNLIENISPFFIRIKKKHLNLPPVKSHLIKVDMDFKQRKIYDFIEKQYVQFFELSQADFKAAEILNKAKLIRLRQTSTDPSMLLNSISESLDQNDLNKSHFDEAIKDEISNVDIFDEIQAFESIIPPKFAAILDLLNTILPKKEKVLIWTIFISNAEKLKNYLKSSGINSELLIGKTPDKDREIIIKRFNNPNNFDLQVVIANPFTIGESISLHKGCHNAFYLERDYNCASFLQSLDRIHRVGLNPDQITNYYYFLSNDSIDEIINERIDIKIKRMAEVIDGDIPLLAGIDKNNDKELAEEVVLRHERKNSSI
jgi:SNF2 family DNA or RNA helicase